jgi:hypothetical protein
MQRNDQRMRAVKGLRWLEAEVRELVDMAKFCSEADEKLFKVQFERVRERISEFEKDLIDLLISYPEARDTAPLRRLLEERSALQQPTRPQDDQGSRLS